MEREQSMTYLTVFGQNKHGVCKCQYVQKRADSCLCRAYYAAGRGETLRDTAQASACEKRRSTSYAFSTNVVRVLLWLVNRFIPLQKSIKSILNGVVVIAVVLWLLNVFGLFSFPFPDPRWNVDDVGETSQEG